MIPATTVIVPKMPGSIAVSNLFIRTVSNVKGNLISKRQTICNRFECDTPPRLSCIDHDHDKKRQGTAASMLLKSITIVCGQRQRFVCYWCRLINGLAYQMHGQKSNSDPIFRSFWRRNLIMKAERTRQSRLTGEQLKPVNLAPRTTVAVAAHSDRYGCRSHTVSSGWARSHSRIDGENVPIGLSPYGAMLCTFAFFFFFFLDYAGNFLSWGVLGGGGGGMNLPSCPSILSSRLGYSHLSVCLFCRSVKEAGKQFRSMSRPSPLAASSVVYITLRHDCQAELDNQSDILKMEEALQIWFMLRPDTWLLLVVVFHGHYVTRLQGFFPEFGRLFDTPRPFDSQY